MATKVIIRSDANSNVGMGHLARDIELAKKLGEEENSKIVFFTGGGDKRVLDFINHHGGFEYREIPSEGEDEFLKHHLSHFSPDLSIVDVLLRDSEDAYMNIFSRYSNKVVAITDDSNPRFIKADVVFNGNPNQKKSHYKNINNGTHYFLGPDFFILNPAFAQAHPMNKEVKKKVENILIAFGGADKNNAPLKVVEALAATNSTAKINILLSPVYNHLKELKEFLQLSGLNYNIVHNVESVIPFLLSADLMFCSAGNICFEASAVGVPLILINQVKRQNEIATTFAQKTFIKNLGMVAETGQEELQRIIAEVTGDHALRQKMSTHQKQFVDGRGLERVAEIIMKLLDRKT